MCGAPAGSYANEVDQGLCWGKWGQPGLRYFLVGRGGHSRASMTAPPTISSPPINLAAVNRSPRNTAASRITNTTLNCQPGRRARQDPIAARGSSTARTDPSQVPTEPERPTREQEDHRGSNRRRDVRVHPFDADFRKHRRRGCKHGEQKRPLEPCHGLASCLRDTLLHMMLSSCAGRPRDSERPDSAAALKNSARVSVPGLLARA
jgi:hypothetical protein